jgi:CubicO group peptidase (beta-lactamase class C family)
MRTIRKLAWFLAAVFIVADLAAAQNGQNGSLAGLDDYINKAIKDWEVPGLAIAVVKDDKIVLAKGFGVRKLGDPTPVDERTLFAIGSSSKAFTAAILATLVDEGKVKWDDPVIKYLPEFQMYDPYVTRELTVRDLLTHRSGLERGDLLWYGTDLSRDEILRRTQYLKPTWSLRSTFGYQNLMYLAAGQLAARVTGKSWDDLVATRIFAPLGMTSSNTTIRDFKEGGNLAAPHTKVEDRLVVIPYRLIDNIGPAGSINSNVVDMAQWLRLQLGTGTFEGKKIFSPAAAREMHTSQTVMRLEGQNTLLYPEAHFMNYGLGWFLSDYKGRKLVEHGGAIDGMRAEVALVPEEKLGIVILTNMNGSVVAMPLVYRIIDAYIKQPEKDWSGDLLKVIKAMTEQGAAAARRADAGRVTGTKPSLSIDSYAGTFRNDLYGDVRITAEGDKLSVRFGPAWNSDLEHWHYDTFRAKFGGGAGVTNATITFALSAQGKADTVTLGMPGVSDYPFKRVVEPPRTVALTGADLRRFVGAYALAAPPLEMTVELAGSELKLNIPGQPLHTLVPLSANTFTIRDVPGGFSAEFNLEGGKVKSLTIVQAGASFTLLPKP